MQYVAYLFELKSIQAYLMAGGKLRDMVNASDLLEQLTQESGCLDEALNIAEIKINNDKNQGPLINFSRRAGGAIYLVAEESQSDKLEQFRLLWTLTVQQILPDCEFVDCLTGADKNALLCVKKGKQQLFVQRSLFYPALPLSTPFTQIAPRTGTAAVASRDKEWLDKASLQKRSYQAAKSNLTAKFNDDENISWPTSLEKGDFPYVGEEKDVAIVHIDGNGLGQVLILLSELVKEEPDGYIQFYSTFSQQLKRATEKAAQKATNEVLLSEANERGEKLLAARPLVLGGDDLTLIIRADLAVSFSQVFIEAFEEYSSHIKKTLTKILKKHNKQSLNLIDHLPERLTSCAGIVFLKPSQPFMMGYELAESLCSNAKRVSKNISTTQIPSSMCWYQIQASVSEEFSTLLKNELSTPDKKQLTLGAYFLGEYQQLATIDSKTAVCPMPRLDDLHQLVQFLRQKNNESISGKLRQWSSLLLLDPNAADDFYQQMEKGLREHNGGKTYSRLIDAQQLLLNYQNEELRWFNQLQQSPIVDLITLTSLEAR